MVEVTIGDYTYTLYGVKEGMYAEVRVTDSTKSTYGEILSEVTYPYDESIVIPVRVMSSCFQGCQSLVTPPAIPNGVHNMYRCFKYCSSLTSAPVIPSSVVEVSECFYECTSLKGDVLAYNIPYSNQSKDMFYNSQHPITIHPASIVSYPNSIDVWEDVVDSHYGNTLSIKIDNRINYTFLSSRRLTSAENVTYGTTRGVRIDMLLDCGDSYALTYMTPSNGKLYAIDDTQITFPYYSPNLLRCYLIYEPSNQVAWDHMQPLSIQIKNIASSFNTLYVIPPNTATISQFEHLSNGAQVRCAPQINYLNSIQLVGKGAPYAMMALVPYLYKSITSNDISNTINRNDNKTQINTLKSDNTLDIKHFVTTADNIQVTTDKTLQDVITECYEALET